MLFTRKPLINASQARTALLLAAGFSSVLLTGCAGSPVSRIGATTKVEYYPNCYEPVQHLRSTDSDMTRSVATGALLGAVGGALTGALVDNDNRGRNAAIGAAGGALVGGAAGYYTERQKQISDDKQRIASYATDIDKSAADMDRTTAYAKASQSCYQREFANLMDGRKAKRIDDTEGRKRLAEIVSGLQESNNLITAVSGRLGENLDNYTQAYEQDLKQVGVQRSDVTVVAQAETAKKTTPKKLPAVPKEAVATEKTLQNATSKKTEAQQVAKAGQDQVNRMCNSPDMGDWAPVPCPNV
ncbi:YMGG-like glycine zipper-containing protein [Pseudomonas guariconensis]|uniref:type VI secretion system-associated lipoprotein TagQ n=1 Tax=Pseudomonas TaxID=286 RepID=UPI001CE48D5E|nr:MULTISPECIES: type VI secretion system-associated lipoprotein TagQ [Pseudomonas]MCO7639652.1 YMGG-like glycine zipper-containing protein [Pseudomonas sp. S 311-6]MCO7514348.1 YMGG-like glycine zipper-containing protein [Pseudomonas putida]MCO7565206.1 YMGG-like glycine zipper-containing protein [Pseudomonas mosselii]MCO7593548.1 YMGG-like glycine zipper-containing protein [Pseudomonas guariconensis]MCO7604401.1 YMGG-like glycine zipper-containing protein [Pseudomonas guariconensis]